MSRKDYILIADIIVDLINDTYEFGLPKEKTETLDNLIVKPNITPEDLKTLTGKGLDTWSKSFKVTMSQSLRRVVFDHCKTLNETA